ncbi:MAG: lactate racemase domain-containing protein [Sphaerochaetaceae bacterium]|nr:lactate racemase domain-containing protein [Sphaerochaetaceae bacterium]
MIAKNSTGFTKQEMQDIAISFIKEREAEKPLKKVLLVGPDFTRFNSNAGILCNYVYNYLAAKGCDVKVLEALGTHVPMTEEQCKEMYGDIPMSAFITHDWRNDVVKIGEVSGEYISSITEGLWSNKIDVEVNRLIMDPSYDLILSVGQVVPHEVIGMANHAKNLFVGVGGYSMINQSHMIGAVYGMERMMGKDFTPVRKIFDYALEHYLSERPIYFMLTVCTAPGGQTQTHGIFTGNTRKVLEDAIALSQEKNIDFVETGIKKCIVYLDPKEFKTTWLGNKSVYRTRMAIADGGDLIVLAPGVERFGEDMGIDTLIRKYGYKGRIETLKQYKANDDLQKNAGCAAHLIHGSSDGRFNITYCVKNISKEEIEGVGFQAADYDEMVAKYNPDKLQYGYNTVDGEEVYFIPNPALGLWINREKFNS